MGIVGSIGQPMGDYGLGYIGIDRNVRTRCQRVGRPTTTGHDRGLSPLRKVSEVAWVHSEVDARRARALPRGTSRPRGRGSGRRWTRLQSAISSRFLWRGGRNLPHAQHSGPRGDPGRRRPAPVPGAPPLVRVGRGGCGAAPEAPLECHSACFYRRLWEAA